MNPQPTIDAMSQAAQTLETGDVREKLHAIQQAQDALDGLKSALLAELHVSKAHEIDGASTLNAWVRNQLRMSSKQASVLVRNSAALNDLALVAESALSGRINAAHVQAFVYGIKHVGLDIMRQHEKAFVKVAEQHDPGKLFEVIKHLKDVIHPDDLDDKWRDGMDKEDFCVDAVPDGWHVTGFLNTITGAKLKKVIDSLAAPRDKDDDRTGPQRRVQAVDDIASALLDSALPSDKGVRPHMSVFVDADTVEAAAQHVKQAAEHPFGAADPMPDVEPATLAGHGHIGPQLLMYFLCISDVTAFLMKNGNTQDQVLNVGRTRRLATYKQRRAVIARQNGVCATPGCHHTHLEIHHVIWYSRGGPTDLDLLVGICSRCHHLVHRDLLTITGNAADGFTFTTRHGKPLRRRRTHYRQAA